MKIGRRLYGDEFMVYNVHTMIHLADDVRTFGSVDNCSAFPFESYLQKLKRMVRSGNNALVQIVKRLGEVDNTVNIPPHQKRVISTKRPNNAYLLDDFTCCEVVEVTHEKNEMVTCRLYTRSGSLFHHPCDSSIIGVYKVCDVHTHIRRLSATRLLTRAMMVDREDGKAIFMAILHDY